MLKSLLDVYNTLTQSYQPESEEEKRCYNKIIEVANTLSLFQTDSNNEIYMVTFKQSRKWTKVENKLKKVTDPEQPDWKEKSEKEVLALEEWKKDWDEDILILRELYRLRISRPFSNVKNWEGVQAILADPNSPFANPASPSTPPYPHLADWKNLDNWKDKAEAIRQAIEKDFQDEDLQRSIPRLEHIKQLNNNLLSVGTNDLQAHLKRIKEKISNQRENVQDESRKKVLDFMEKYWLQLTVFVQWPEVDMDQKALVNHTRFIPLESFAPQSPKNEERINQEKVENIVKNTSNHLSKDELSIISSVLEQKKGEESEPTAIKAIFLYEAVKGKAHHLSSGPCMPKLPNDSVTYVTSLQFKKIYTFTPDPQKKDPLMDIMEKITLCAMRHVNKKLSNKAKRIGIKESFFERLEESPAEPKDKAKEEQRPSKSSSAKMPRPNSRPLETNQKSVSQTLPKRDRTFSK